MYQTSRIDISKTSELYHYSEEYCRLAKSLRNAAVFRVRQIFTGYDLPDDERNANQKEVFAEVAALEAAYPSVKVGKLISYGHLEKLMRVTYNPDFFAGLPMQTAQQILKQVIFDFRNWLKALRKYKKDPSSYAGRPKMPRYTKSDATTFTITNQDAVIRNGRLKLPKTRLTVSVPHLGSDAVLKEVEIKPYYGRYLLLLTIEVSAPDRRTDLPNFAAVDFGTSNFAAIVSSDFASGLYKGGAVLADDQYFAKKRAELAAIITKGHDRQKVSSRWLRNLSYRHANFSRDQLHKISRSIVNYCLEHKVGTIVLGVNKGWKVRSHIGDQNNQKFVMLPITVLRDMITYKAILAGITVIEQEESYTSKADFMACDDIPVYGKVESEPVFSGSRISRGLYKGVAGIVNADCNAAANILRKAIPDAWHEVCDPSFLSHPEVLGFHELNPPGNPVKRIVAA